MIYGIGTDIVKISRLEKLKERYGDKFLERILSQKEIGNIPKENPMQFIAGRFAIKESLVKAFNNGKIKFSAVTVLNEDNGKPYIDNPEIFDNIIGNDEYKIHITISHEDEFATGFVVVEVN